MEVQCAHVSVESVLEIGHVFNWKCLVVVLRIVWWFLCVPFETTTRFYNRKKIQM